MAELAKVEAEIRAASGRKNGKRAASKEKRRNEEDAAIRRRRVVYAAVDKRSGGVCEYGDNGAIVCLVGADEHDHFWGRGKAEETPENVWHLCKFHHDRKGANEPSRAEWIRQFRRHCFRYGYWTEVEKCARAIALETAQHPRSTPTPSESR